MRGHDDQVAASGLCCFDNRSGWVRIRNMQEFYRYPDLLPHSSSFIEHFARTFLAGCLKAIKLFLRGNPSPGVSTAIVDLQRLGYGDDCRSSVQGPFRPFSAKWRDARGAERWLNLRSGGYTRGGSLRQTMIHTGAISCAAFLAPTALRSKADCNLVRC